MCLMPIQFWLQSINYSEAWLVTISKGLPIKHGCHFSNTKIQPNISLSVADHLLSTSDKCLEKYFTGCYYLFISYSNIAPVVKPEVSARTLLGKVGLKMLRTGAQVYTRFNSYKAFI